MSNYTDKPWLGSYTPEVPSSLEYPDIPLHAFLKRSADEYPGRPAIIYQTVDGGPHDSTITYQQLDEMSRRFAAALVDLGVSKGDRVSYFMQNCPQLVIAFYGILKAGAAPAPCNLMYRQEELAHQLADTEPALVVCDADRYPLVASLASAGPFPQVVVIGDVPSTLSFDELLAQHPPISAPIPR